MTKNIFRIYEGAVVNVKYPVYPKRGHIGSGVFIALTNLHMKEGAQINAHSSITGMGDLAMGAYSTVGYGVRIITGTDTPRGKALNDYAPDEERHVITGIVTIGDRCLIGSNSVICVSEKNPHIHIDDNTIVKALSYVGKSIGPDVIYSGSTTLRVTTKRLPHEVE